MADTNLLDIRTGYHYVGILGGKERYIRFDLNAFAEMERIYGSMEAANEALSKGSMTDVRRILWLGLIHDQAVLDEITGEPIRYKITIYEVGSWITPDNMKDIMHKLNTAISGSVPTDQEIAPTGVTPAQAHEQATAEVLPTVTPFKNPN